MKSWRLIISRGACVTMLLAVLSLSACGPPAGGRVASGPAKVRVEHILIAFQGSLGKLGTIQRSQAEAMRLAGEILARAQAGEPFDVLMRQYSDDPGPGEYGLTDDGAAPVTEYYPRRVVVQAFGDLAFRLDIGAIGMATYDPVTSPLGWHIIKRIE